MGRFLIHPMPSGNMEKMFRKGGVQRKNGIAIRQVLSRREGNLLGEKTLWSRKDLASNSNSASSVMKAKLLNLSISLLNFKMRIVIPFHSGGVIKRR